MSQPWPRAGRVPPRRLSLIALTALLVLAALSLPFLPRFAAVAQDGTPTPDPIDTFCVVGSVIDFEENPLTDGWTVVARPVIDGVPDEDSSIAVVSDENGAFRFDDLAAGEWEFLIELREGWEGVTPTAFRVVLEYGVPGCLEIRFKLRQLVVVTVTKYDAEYALLDGWTITATPGRGNLFAVPQEGVTISGTVVFTLTPGLWLFSEEPPEDVRYDSVFPDLGTQLLDVQPPGPYEIAFKNRILASGCLVVTKLDQRPDADPLPLPGWTVLVRRADGSVAQSGVTDATGVITFEGLPLGPYIVEEEMQVGWGAISATAFEVTLVDDLCQEITFINQQIALDFCIEGRKIDSNGLIGLPGWEITAAPLAIGGFEPEPVLTDGLGAYRFSLPVDDYRIPGSRYRVCETAQEGWLPHTSSCFTVTVPQAAGVCVRVPTFENQQTGHGVAAPVSTAQRPAGSVDRAGCRFYHTVTAGQGLYTIADLYGAPRGLLLQANPWALARPNYTLFIGENVCVP